MKLYNQVRNKLRLLHYAIDTEECDLRWIDTFIGFHRKGNVWRFRKGSLLRCRLKRPKWRTVKLVLDLGGEISSNFFPLW